MKRTFRQCAVIAGLIERHHPGQKKTGRQVTISTDLIFDVLRKHEPNCVFCGSSKKVSEFKGKNVCEICRKELAENQ